VKGRVKGSLNGLRPFKNNLSPSPWKERGIQGVRLKISSYYIQELCQPLWEQRKKEENDQSM
jgi:hypothetical protein